MASYPYTPNPNNVKELFEKIQTIGIPKVKINVPFLKSLGFKSSYDTYLPSVLKFLGFIAGDGSPSSIWQSYGVKTQARRVMASAVKTAYHDLFSVFNEANTKDNKSLADFFKGQTGESDKNVGHMVQTFKVLCELSDFGATKPQENESVPSGSPEGSTPKIRVLPGLQLNIEIHIAADTSDDKIEAIFKNMKQYLLTND
jgi:hypothetical protein